MNVEIETPGLIEIEGDVARVSFERHYLRPRHDVWRALTDPAQVAVWLDDATVDLRVGGRFEVRFDDGTMHGRITELVDGRVLAYSWDEGTDHESHVRWELADDGGGTRLRLVHNRLARGSASPYAAGWHHHLELLVALLDGTPQEWSQGRFVELEDQYNAAR
jgi:uncharacterized protein YndB with AHSA1/START domain